MGLLPGAGGGEGVACCLGSIVPAATRGHPCLGVGSSTVGEVGEGAEPGPVGVEKLHRSAHSVIGVTARYQDH